MDGLGAVLSQVPAAEERVRQVAFASKALSRSQAKYSAHRLEFLALKWAMSDKFSHWLKALLSGLITILSLTSEAGCLSAALGFQACTILL